MTAAPRHDNQIRDTEGRKIGAYKIREDDAGKWIKRHGMRGAIELKEHKSRDGFIWLTWYQVVYYEDFKSEAA